MIVNINSRFGIGTQLLQPTSPLGPVHKEGGWGTAPNGEEVVLNHPKGQRSRFELVRDFVAGTPTYIGKRGPVSVQEQVAIQARAFQVAGKPYDLVFWNCEHSSTFIRTGKPESLQLAIG